MATISLRVNDDDLKLLQEYVAVNGLNMSAFIREAVMDRIEDDLSLDEERILKAREQAHQEKVYSFEKAWAEIGV